MSIYVNLHVLSSNLKIVWNIFETDEQIKSKRLLKSTFWDILCNCVKREAGYMVAGDVEFVFASRNERSLKQIQIKTWNNYGEKNALYFSKSTFSMFCNQCKNLLEETYLQSFWKITAMLVRLAQTISSKYYILLFSLNLIRTIIVILLVYFTVFLDVTFVLHQARGGGGGCFSL